MLRRKLVCFVYLCGFMAFVLVPPAQAANTSTPVTVTLSAVKSESITVTLTTPGPVNFTLTGSSTDTGSVSPAWTTVWNLNPSRTTVTVCAYLSGALAGTGGNTDTVPMANVLAQPGGAGPFLALTGSGCGQVGNAVVIHTTALTAVNQKNFSQNDSVALEINDSALTLQADTYTGTLNIVAQATP